KLHNERREFEAAVALLEKARTHFQTALKAKPKDREFRKSYRDYLVLLAQSRVGRGDHTSLATTAAELAGFGFEPAKDSYDAACFSARCATLANQDAPLPEDKRKGLVQTYSQQSLAFLQQAVSRGFKDVTRMKKDADLEPLRRREEFQKLLTELEAKM